MEKADLMQDRKGNKEFCEDHSRKTNYNHLFFLKPLPCSYGECLSVPGIWEWATKQTLKFMNIIK